jgi:hypothetical protein
MPWWVLVLGCTGPKLERLAPEAVFAGDTVTLTGVDLVPELQATLRHPDDARTVALSAVTPTSAEIQLPADLRVGMWEVTLHGEGWPAPEGLATFEVWTPETEPACTKRYALRTETSRVRRTISVDRILQGRPTEELRFEESDVARLHYAAEGACHALWLETTSGRRVLLADGDSAELLDRSIMISEALKVELVQPEATLQDATPLPSEQDPR